jgi:hypothetical protein
MPISVIRALVVGGLLLVLPMIAPQYLKANAMQASPGAPATVEKPEAVGSANSKDTGSVSATNANDESGSTKPDDSSPARIDPKSGKPLYETIRENWASLSVKGSELKPEPPLVAQVEEEEKFTRTLVSLKWRPGDPIDVYVVVPKDVKKSPAVLYLYGYQEDTDRFKDDRWCERVTSGGVAAVGFVSAMSGHRFHDRPLKQWFVSELQESLGSTVHDVKFILDYLNARGDIDMSRIGMFGQGSGATIAILAAAADPRIKAIDLLEPWGDWPVWLAKSSVVQDDPEKSRYTKKDFLDKVAPLDPVKWLPSLKSTQIRMQQVADNDSNPLQCQDRLRTAAPKQAQVTRFDSVAEMTTMEGGGRLFDWIKEQLRKPSPGKPVKTAVAKTTPAPTRSARP